MKNKIVALICTYVLFFAIPVLAKEKIESFDSLIQVQTDGSMIVTETLRVHHEGINIRRGIYRDLPTRKGEKYELLGVTRNGYPEPSFVERSSDYYRINTGDDSFLPHPATSTFEIKYKVWNIPKSYDGYDEVYWNVTGDQWSFPIENVSARIELPYGADIIQQASYVGYIGSQESASYQGDGVYMGRYLSPGEQLTIAVGFAPGVVSTEKYISMEYVLINVTTFVLYLIYLGFLIWAWYKVGRDPVGRAVMPQYEAPKELTAAQAAWLYNKGWVSNIVPISLIQMIVNGFLKMTTDELGLLFSRKIYILEKTGKNPSNPEEKCIPKEKIMLDGKYHKRIDLLSSCIESKVSDRMSLFYAKNHSWVLYPTLLLLFCLVFLFVRVSSLQEGNGLFSYLYPPTLMLVVIITSIIFSFLIHQPTEKGKRLTEHLEGLKMFLKATKLPENERLKLEEKLTPENMEKLFPYAMALGLEKEWEKKFSNIFGPTVYQDFKHRCPHMSHSFCSSFSSNVIRCFTPPSTSGRSASGGFGSRGGGSAGGGFGGGGGGGR